MDKDENIKIKDWNVPNWRNLDEYEYVIKLSADRIRWEFLRRTLFYRNSWDTGDYSSDLDFGLREMYSPRVRGDELPRDFIFLDGIALGMPLSVDGQTLDRGYLVELSKNFSEEEIERKIGEYVISLLNRKYELFLFDPNIKVSGQTAIAEKKLSEMQSSLIKAPIENRAEIIKLLRVMDAFNEVGMRAKKSWDHGEKKSVAQKIFDKKLDESVTSKLLDEKFEQACNMAKRIALNK